MGPKVTCKKLESWGQTASKMQREASSLQPGLRLLPSPSSQLLAHRGLGWLCLPALPNWSSPILPSGVKRSVATAPPTGSLQYYSYCSELWLGLCIQIWPPPSASSFLLDLELCPEATLIGWGLNPWHNPCQLPSPKVTTAP